MPEAWFHVASKNAKMLKYSPLETKSPSQIRCSILQRTFIIWRQVIWKVNRSGLKTEGWYPVWLGWSKWTHRGKQLCAVRRRWEIHRVLQPNVVITQSWNNKHLAQGSDLITATTQPEEQRRWHTNHPSRLCLKLTTRAAAAIRHSNPDTYY